MNLQAEILHWCSTIRKDNRRGVIRKLAFRFGIAAKKQQQKNNISITFILVSYFQIFKNVFNTTSQTQSSILWEGKIKSYKSNQIKSKHQELLRELSFPERWILNLTCALAVDNPKSSPADHQSSSGGGQRWEHSGEPCRWCPAPQWRSDRFCSGHICKGCRPCGQKAVDTLGPSEGVKSALTSASQ